MNGTRHISQTKKIDSKPPSVPIEQITELKQFMDTSQEPETEIVAQPVAQDEDLRTFRPIQNPTDFTCLSFHDKLLSHKVEELQASEEQVKRMMAMLTHVEQALKRVSDKIAENDRNECV